MNRADQQAWGRIGAHKLWATHDRMTTTAPMREAATTKLNARGGRGQSGGSG